MHKQRKISIERFVLPAAYMLDYLNDIFAVSPRKQKQGLIDNIRTLLQLLDTAERRNLRKFTKPIAGGIPPSAADALMIVAALNSRGVVATHKLTCYFFRLYVSLYRPSFSGARNPGNTANIRIGRGLSWLLDHKCMSRIAVGVDGMVLTRKGLELVEGHCPDSLLGELFTVEDELVVTRTTVLSTYPITFYTPRWRRDAFIPMPTGKELADLMRKAEDSDRDSEGSQFSGNSQAGKRSRGTEQK